MTFMSLEGSFRRIFNTDIMELRVLVLNSEVGLKIETVGVTGDFSQSVPDVPLPPFL